MNMENPHQTGSAGKSIYMQTDLKNMNVESHRGPKRPQKCLLRLNSIFSSTNYTHITMVTFTIKSTEFADRSIVTDQDDLADRTKLTNKSAYWALEMWTFCHFGYMLVLSSLSLLFTPYKDWWSSYSGLFVCDEKDTGFSL